MVAGRTVATLIVIVLFLGYIYTANMYVQMTYFRRNNAGPAVPIQQTIEEITFYIQVAIAVVIASIAAVVAIRSRKILGIIPLEDLQRHLLLLGPTGSGKTSIAKNIITRAIKKGIKVTIIDWKAGAGLVDT